MRKKEKEETAERRATQLEGKKRKKSERNNPKRIQLPQTGKRKASKKPSTKPLAKKQCVGGARGGVAAEAPSQTIPTRTTQIGRNTKVPHKYE